MPLISRERKKPWIERHECIAVEIISAAGLVPKSKGTQRQGLSFPCQMPIMWIHKAKSLT